MRNSAGKKWRSLAPRNIRVPKDSVADLIQAIGIRDEVAEFAEIVASVPVLEVPRAPRWRKFLARVASWFRA